MRVLRRSSPLAIAVGVLVACNAISGLDEDFVLAPPDGGPVGLDGTAAEDSATATDGSTSDDGSTIDAPTDGGGSDAFTCTTIDAAFCSDFDIDSGPWTAEELDAGAVTFELDAGQFGTGAMHAHVDNAPGISRRAALWKRISNTDAKTYVHYDVEFDFRVANKTFPYSAIGIFALTQPAGGGGLRFYGAASHGGDALDVVDDAPLAKADPVVDDTGTWHHARIDFDREGSGTYATSLKIDTTVVDTRQGFDFGDAQTAELRIGILFTSTVAGTMDLYVDNIVVRRVK